MTLHRTRQAISTAWAIIAALLVVALMSMSMVAIANSSAGAEDRRPPTVSLEKSKAEKQKPPSPCRDGRCPIFIE